MTPMLARWIYIGSIVVISMTTIFCFGFAWWLASWFLGWFFGLVAMAMAPLIGFVLLLVARVACESVLIRYNRAAPPPRA
ncbi:hypothetical protein DMH08_35740 [Actinomadura sp. WAC 06369]|nr:hypothetical protein DMH08_35740 [Actinomadura sp. WAC 06369]